MSVARRAPGGGVRPAAGRPARLCALPAARALGLAAALAGCGAPPAGDSAGAPASWTDPGLALGDPLPCDAPATTVSYAERGAELGLAGAGDSDAGHHHGGSAVVADLDGDGDRDIVLSYPDGPPVLYRREPEGFRPERLPAPASAFLLNLADLDGDGVLDLLAGAYRALPVALRNDGSAGFSALRMPPLPLSGERVRELAPADIDGDGEMDLYAMANSGGSDPASRTDFVLLGDGAGGFTVDPAQEVSTGRGFDVVWADQDADGDPDAYVVNDDGADYGPNRMLTNDGGRLVPGGEACTCELVHFGMGGDAADVNGDGLPDYYLTAVGHNVLLESLGDGSYVDTAQARGADPIVDAVHMGWGAIWLDHDNDAVLDVLVAQGDRWAEDGDESFGIVYDAPLNLLRGGADGYAEVGPGLGLAQAGSFRSVVADDLNGDGVLDLLATDVVARPRLYLSEGCTAAGWLRVEAPPHTRVELEAGGRRQVGWTTTESSYGAGHASFLHLGLGDTGWVDRVVLTDRYGRVRTAGGFAPRRTLRVE